MLNSETINNLIEINEPSKMPYRLNEILSCETDKNELFNELLKHETNLTYDWFLEYYQQEHANRKILMQDFTPKEIAEIASTILGFSKSSMDICSGTGGLTIKRWVDNPNQKFYCEEISDRVIPFLLINLSIRNIEGIVKHGDSLTRQFKAIYKLTKGERFSQIEKTEDIEIKSETIVMNPPYSMTWEHKVEYLQENRFKDFEKLAPKSKADYAFLLTGIDQLTDSGKMVIILPHGILFRTGAEGVIRENLIKQNLIEAVIGLPEKLFRDTSIPTVLLVLNNNKQNTDILFIDASNEFEKMRRQNRLRPENIKKITTTYKNYNDIEKYAHVASFNEIKANDYNLNIARYVDTFKQEAEIRLNEINKLLKQDDEEIIKLEAIVNAQLSILGI